MVRIRSSAGRSGTPRWLDAARARVASASLALPGRRRASSKDSPVGLVILPSATDQVGVGRAKPQSQYQSVAPPCTRMPQRGHEVESPRQLPPALTQIVVSASIAAEVTSTSSQLAMTVVLRSRAIAVRRLRSVCRTSPTRSIWSRLRFSSTITAGCTASEIFGR